MTVMSQRTAAGADERDETVGCLCRAVGDKPVAPTSSPRRGGPSAAASPIWPSRAGSSRAGPMPRARLSTPSSARAMAASGSRPVPSECCAISQEHACSYRFEGQSDPWGTLGPPALRWSSRIATPGGR